MDERIDVVEKLKADYTTCDRDLRRNVKTIQNAHESHQKEVLHISHLISVNGTGVQYSRSKQQYENVV